MMTVILFSLPLFSRAGVGVDNILDSYAVASSEEGRMAMSDEEMQKTPFTVQVASYINEKDAVSHLTELKSKEKDVSYFPTFVRGQVWFKVCAGKFDKREKAEAYRKDFAKRLDEPFAVVISLLDRPEKTAMADAAPMLEKKMKEDEKRDPASVAAKRAEQLPFDAKAAARDNGAMPEVKLIAKPKTHASTEKPAMKVATKEEPKAEMKVAVKTEPKAEPKAEMKAEPKTAMKSEPKPESKMAVKEEMKPAAGAMVANMLQDRDHFYSIQIAAFPAEADAKERLASLQIKGLDAFYKMGMVNGKAWYRLMIGKFKTKREAEAYQKGGFQEQMRDAESFIRRVTASE